MTTNDSEDRAQTAQVSGPSREAVNCGLERGQPPKKTTALLTGAAGKIGKYVIAELSRRGVEVLATDLVCKSIPPATRFERCDLTDAETSMRSCVWWTLCRRPINTASRNYFAGQSLQPARRRRSKKTLCRHLLAATP
ncbi:MAG: NAD-dependent epimerase/dehydratase family protein [Polyangiales bacterium]